jgi:hypothetical protein
MLMRCDAMLKGKEKHLVMSEFDSSFSGSDRLNSVRAGGAERVLYHDGAGDFTR